jgi:hypothetical protein
MFPIRVGYLSLPVINGNVAAICNPDPQFPINGLRCPWKGSANKVLSLRRPAIGFASTSYHLREALHLLAVSSSGASDDSGGSSGDANSGDASGGGSSDDASGGKDPCSAPRRWHRSSRQGKTRRRSIGLGDVSWGFSCSLLTTRTRSAFDRPFQNLKFLTFQAALSLCVRSSNNCRSPIAGTFPLRGAATDGVLDSEALHRHGTIPQFSNSYRLPTVSMGPSKPGPPAATYPSLAPCSFGLTQKA